MFMSLKSFHGNGLWINVQNIKQKTCKEECKGQVSLEITIEYREYRNIFSLIKLLRTRYD